MLKFSVNLSMLFTEVELINRFKAAKQCGFDAVEIQFPYVLTAEAIAHQLREHQLKLVLFNINADDLLQGGEGLACVPEKKQSFKIALAQAIKYTEILKPTAVNILPGRCLDKSRLPDYLNTFRENLLFAANALAPLGVKAVFEAINTFDMPGFIIHRGDQMLAILAELNHPNLYMQYDIYHMHRMGENCSAFIKNHANKIGHIQFADYPGRNQPGTGEIHFDPLFNDIQQSSYKGWCGAEYKPAGKSSETLEWLNVRRQPASTKS